MCCQATVFSRRGRQKRAPPQAPGERPARFCAPQTLAPAAMARNDKAFLLPPTHSAFCQASVDPRRPVPQRAPGGARLLPMLKARSLPTAQKRGALTTHPRDPALSVSCCSCSGAFSTASGPPLVPRRIPPAWQFVGESRAASGLSNRTLDSCPGLSETARSWVLHQLARLVPPYDSPAVGVWLCHGGRGGTCLRNGPGPSSDDWLSRRRRC